MSKRVLIVKEGQWGWVEPEEYQELIKLYTGILEEAKDSLGNQLAQVTIVDTIKEAEARIRMEADVVVFVSRGVEEEAERIAREHPKIRVIVFTGLIPGGKVVWVQKTWAASRESIQNIILYS